MKKSTETPDEKKAVKPPKKTKKQEKRASDAPAKPKDTGIVSSGSPQIEETPVRKDPDKALGHVVESVSLMLEGNAQLRAVETNAPVSEPQKASDASVDAPIERYDVMITSERAGYRPPKAAVMSMVQQLVFRGFATPTDEAVAEKWAEIYFEPGPAGHEIFLERAYDSKVPVYLEMMMRFSEKPFYCDYTDTPQRPLYWCIEIRGARFKAPLGSFKKLFLDALNLRIAVNVRAAMPLPEHRTVPEEELPVEKKKKERGAGIVGTEVEEI